ncbi:MAG: 30S ribosomal protein S17 [Candidatus Nanoarchaeia archaeon]
MQEKNRIKNPGMNIPLPKEQSPNYDRKSPFGGDVKLRGKSFTGTVVSTKMQRTAVVVWEGRRLIPKFERYKKTRTKVSAHNPDVINAKEGDIVVVTECRPLSKTKNFVITKVLGKEEGYQLTKQMDEEGKHKMKRKEIENIEAKE